MNTFPLAFGAVSFVNDSSIFSLSGPSVFNDTDSDPPSNASFNLSNGLFRASVSWTDAGGVNSPSWELALPFFAQMLGTNGAIIETSCIYPLSGQYDHLPRVLFYVLLLVAVLFRRNSWIVSAALGVAMSYSASAALHFFVLLAMDGFRVGDVDYFGIFPVLATSVVMLTPVFTWSSTFRTHRAKAVILYWALLVYVALGFMMFLVSGFKQYLQIGGADTSNYLLTVQGFSICNSSVPACSQEALDNNLSYESYQSCNCIDFCTLLTPRSPLRSGQNMVTNVGRNKTTSLTYSEGGYVRPLFLDLTIVTQFVLLFALVQGSITLLQGSSTQQQVRDGIYRALSMKARRVFNRRESVYLSRAEQHENLYREIRHWFAKLVAGLYYILTIFTVVLYLPVFVLTVGISEILVADFPESEHSDAVGAWTPWVSAALIVFGTLILNYHSPLTNAINQWVRAIFRCGRPRQGPDEELKGINESHRPGLRSTADDSFRTVFKHADYEIRLFFWRIKHRFVELGEWWKDPHHNEESDETEKQRKADLQEEVDRLKLELRRIEASLNRPSHAPGAPTCFCRNCGGDEYMAAPRVDRIAVSEPGGALSKPRDTAIVELQPLKGS